MIAVWQKKILTRMFVIWVRPKELITITKRNHFRVERVKFKSGVLTFSLICGCWSSADLCSWFPSDKEKTESEMYVGPWILAN